MWRGGIVGVKRSIKSTCHWQNLPHLVRNQKPQSWWDRRCCGWTQSPRKQRVQPPEFRPLWSPSASPLLLPFHPPSPHTPTHHPPALCTPPQKSSDSWKVLGVYSVTTKQNHLKTKWAGECAGAIWALCLCGHGEKRPLRIKGMEDGQGEARHFNLQVIPPVHSPRPALTTTAPPPHTPTLLSAPFKGEHAIWNRAACVTVPPRRRYSLSFPFSYFSFSSKPLAFALLSLHILIHGIFFQ